MLFFFLGGYLPPGLRGDPGNGSPRPAEDKLLTHLCNQTSKVALSISFRGRNGGTEVRRCLLPLSDKFFELNISHRFATVASGLLGWRP